VREKIALITEGPIDRILLAALLSRIAAEREGIKWPVDAGDIADEFRIRKKGHGGVLETVRSLVKALASSESDHSFFVIVLDRRTKAVQNKIRRLVRGQDRFVVGVAIEEIEAWWLGDRTNTLQWTSFAAAGLPSCRYAQQGYRAEEDPTPKTTLNELTQLSDRFDRVYGRGNVDLTEDFAERYWRPNARLSEIAEQCPMGYVPFETAICEQFKRSKRQST
jgi:hypothetical protein